LTGSAELFDRKTAGIELREQLLDVSDPLVDKVVDLSSLVEIACRMYAPNTVEFALTSLEVAFALLSKENKEADELTLPNTVLKW